MFNKFLKVDILRYGLKSDLIYIEKDTVRWYTSIVHDTYWDLKIERDYSYLLTEILFIDSRKWIPLLSNKMSTAIKTHLYTKSTFIDDVLS